MTEQEYLSMGASPEMAKALTASDEALSIRLRRLMLVLHERMLSDTDRAFLGPRFFDVDRPRR